MYRNESKRLTTHVGDQIVITDINVCQRIYPAHVKFAEIEAAVEVDRDAGMITVDFEGCESDGFYDGDDDIPTARRQLALEVADMLEEDGVIIGGRPSYSL